MEVAMVSAVTGALKPVLEKLGALVGDKYKRFKGVRDDIKSLIRELTAMDAFLLKMSEEEDLDVQDKVWMNEVRELSYDMEDSIDDFMQSVDGEDTKPDGFLEKMKNLLGKLGKMKARRRISNEIQNLKKQIIEVGERNKRYNVHEVSSKTKNEASSKNKNATIDIRALAIFQHASELVRIDEPKAEVIKLLTEGASTLEKIKLVSIIGSGGLGKTTLLNQVYQDLKGEFKCWAFLSVSRNPDMMSIFRTILGEVSRQRYADTKAMSIQQIISKITGFLADQRYFVVLDDIWDVDTWNVLKLAFPVTSSSSIIITTTRINGVAESCRSTPFNGDIYCIRPLDMVHSRQLFYTRLFNFEENCPSYLKKVSENILKKCAGLPLAIIAISGLLANTERTEGPWKKVEDSIGRALQRNPSVEGMMKILSLSYFDLPAHLKSCLLCLSIFPEDSVIKKKVLINRWIAERLIHTEAGYSTTYEFGERCFNELINRSLIQPGKTDTNGMVKSCRLHDTILDFIISKSIEENFVTLVGVPGLTVRTQSKVCRLSMQIGKQKELIVPRGLMLSHVRSLNVFGISVKIPSMDNFRHLRFLDFGGCKQLKNHHLENIGRLLQLRYVSLREAECITKLPEQIRHLCCLEVLDLRGTSVCELPSSIVNLKSLVQLLIGVQEVKLPCGISKMQALEKLKHVSVHSQTFNFLEELVQQKSLKNLAMSFEGYSIDHVTKKAIIVASVRNLGNLLCLSVRRCLELFEESLCPVPLGLQKLLSTYSTIPQVPVWVGSLVNLQHLGLQVMEVDQKDLSILGGLPVLRILSLSISASPKDTLAICGEAGFSSLRTFQYRSYYGVNLMFAAGAMPEVDYLNLELCTNEESGTIYLGIENLPSLHKITCRLRCAQGCYQIVSPAKAAMLKAANEHPNHPSLSFSDE